MTNQPQKTSVGRLGRLNVFMSFELGNAARGGGGGGEGVTPSNDTRRLRLKGVLLSGLFLYERR